MIGGVLIEVGRPRRSEVVLQRRVQEVSGSMQPHSGAHHTRRGRSELDEESSVALLQRDTLTDWLSHPVGALEVVGDCLVPRSWLGG